VIVTAEFRVPDIEELLDVMEQWDIAELHLQVEDARLDLVRSVPASAVPAQVTESPLSAPPPALPEAAGSPRAEPVTIVAPVVGLFHLATRGFPQGMPRPSDPVQAGQSLGAIELMHIPSDLISPVSGIIEGILAEDGAGVEYGQPLMIIHPYEEVSEDEAGMLPPPR
jgi:acetyl-CoA carboxylase biotin carboxyl carrier protein